jgi:hypothetical protein
VGRALGTLIGPVGPAVPLASRAGRSPTEGRFVHFYNAAYGVLTTDEITAARATELRVASTRTTRADLKSRGK